MNAISKTDHLNKLSNNNEELHDYVINALDSVEESIQKLNFYKKKLELLVKDTKI